ncbi:MAG: Ig-like domain-containing protein, partial [Wenzhouxiangella sp.]|nr:Ig-like domain-containing protein [Wenzhouxiangella sp.]
IDLSTLNAEVGAQVTIPILVTGDATAPLDGVASVDAETGEVCLQTDRAPVAGQAAARRFDCEITFRSAGEHELSLGFSVSETHESSALLVTIPVTRPAGATNEPPVAESQTLTVEPDTPRLINLVASDPDGDPLTFLLRSPPGNGTLSGTPPNITYTPNMGFVGEDSFTFGVTDGLANSGPAVITLLVSDTPVPVADSQTLHLDEDTDLALTLTGTASDMGSLTFAIESGPEFGVLSGTPPNLTYVPNANFFGVDSFSFTVADSSGSSEPATINLIVAAVNDPPTFAAGGDLTYPASTSGLQTEEGWASLISGGPMEMDAVTFALTPTDPDGVLTSIRLSASGTLEIDLTGTPGTATVQVVATDSMGASSAPVSFTVTVEAEAPEEDLIFSNSFEAQ